MNRRLDPAIMHIMPSVNLQKPIAIILDQIAGQGYAVAKDFLSHKEVCALALAAKTLHASGEMKKATTGLTRTITQPIRGDFIHWLEEDQASEAETPYLDAMEELQDAMNQHFFLGLFELESHFAIYPPGAAYQKHLDQFIGKDERKVSAILYLNESWQAQDGGALRMYLDKKDGSNFIDILPAAGTLVVFLSSDFLHEVLPAKRERISVTAWFRTRSLNA